MTVINERYDLKERVGEGGMAIVYRAMQLKLNREVAIKFIKTDVLGESFISRFEREAKAVAQLNHPNITQVYDFDYDNDGKPFMVMELLHGDDLSHYIKQHAPLHLSDILTIVEGAATALGYAHERGIVHRDVKPSNIFITSAQHIKLMDFGLVKQLTEADGLTHTGIILGTPRYFSPEQANGGNLADHRSDLYSLGVVFYELLTNQPLFDGETALSIAVKHATTPAPDPLIARPDLPPIASTIILKMLAKNPDERYQTASALLSDLQEMRKILQSDSGILPRAAMTITDSTETAIGADRTDASLTQSAANTPTVTQDTQKQFIQSSGILALLVVIAILVGVGAIIVLTQTDAETTGTAAITPLDVTPAQADEYLILVGQWGSESDTLERRIVESLRSSDAVAISPHTTVRVEATERQIVDSNEAAELADEVKAHLVVWGIEDEVGLEVVFQDIYAEPNSVEILRFLVPRNEDYNIVLAEDMPIALGHYFSSMLLHHLVRTTDIDGLAAFAFTSVGISSTDLRIIPPSDLDGHIFNLYQESTTEDIDAMIAATSNALRLVPGDPSLVFLRGFYEAFYRGDIARARVDAIRLREIMGSNNLTIWMDMNISLVEQDYEQVLALSEELDANALGYGVPFSYRQVALLMTGDFARVQDETQGTITEDAVLGLPVWDTLSTMVYAIQGDETSFASISNEVATNRDLEDSATFITNISSPPVDFYLIGGYIAALAGDSATARLAYLFGLQQSPDHYILNWLAAGTFRANGNVQDAYDRLVNAEQNAPAPFPIATFERAKLILEHRDSVPEDAPEACDLLNRAEKAALQNVDFFQPLLNQIAEYDDQWECLS